MIPILVLFALIAWFEAHNLSAKKPGKQKIAPVMAFIAVCALASVTLYILRSSFHLATVIQNVYGPLESAITSVMQ